MKTAKKRAAKPKFMARGAFQRRNPDKPIEHPAVRRQSENYGWPIFLVRSPTGVRVAVGCRWFSFEQAVPHWADHTKSTDWVASHRNCSSCKATAERFANMRKLLPKLKQRARRLGWL